MKKVFLGITAIVLGLSFVFIFNDVSAASYSVYLSGGGSFSDSVYVYLSVSGSASMGGACGGICGVSGALSYDSSKIEMTAASGLQGFDYTQGTNIVLYKTTAASDGGIVSWRFRNIGLASGESTTVTVSNISATNGDTEESLGSSSINLQYIAPQQPAPAQNNESYSTNTSSISTDENDNSDSDEKEKSDTENDKNKEKTSSSLKKSSNASLKKIKLSVGEIEFDKNTLSYDLAVDKDVSNITIGAQSENSRATVNGAGTFDLKYGLNEFKLVVKAEDGTEKEYVLKVYREGANETIGNFENLVGGLVAGIIVLSVAVVGLIVGLIVYKKNSYKKLFKNIGEK